VPAINFKVAAAPWMRRRWQVRDTEGKRRTLKGTVGIIGGKDRQIEDLVRACGLRPVVLKPDQLATGSPVTETDVVLVDVRDNRQLLSVVTTVKRRYPSLGIAIIAASLDPELMLEAMRAGVTECVADPVTQSGVEAALGRVMAQRSAPVEGQVFAFVGAKGGVGATTLAVNLAEVFARTAGETLFIDLNVHTGDAAVFLGVEPRFTVLDALENTHRLDEAFFKGFVVRTRSGLDLLASSTLMTGAIDPERVRTLVDFAVRHYRCVVLDVPRWEPSLLDALEVASSIFVVVNHELPTVRSASRLIGRLRQRYGTDRVGLLVNRSDQHSQISVADIEKAVNAKARHTFPNDYRHAMGAINKGNPMSDRSQGRLGAAFDAFGKSLVGSSKETPADEPNRLFGWLSPRRSTT
jgi:pilus assembly protein CpaE